MKTPTRVIVIDDDLVNNMLCSHTIKNTEHEMEIQTFNIPEQGFKYIVEHYSKTENETPTILFLDINMPSWSGWDFLNNFDALNDNIKRQFKIYMLSSSVDPNDIERAKANRNVVDFVVKPLTSKKVLSILGDKQNVVTAV